MGDWTSRDLVTEAVEPTGTDFDGIWEGFFGIYGTASIDGTIKKVGSYSIKFVMEDDDWTDLFYDFDSDKNLTQYTFVEFWIKVDEWNELKSGSDKAQFGLDSWDGYRWWYIKEFITSGDWIYVKVDLSDYDESQSGFDITAVTGLMFYCEYASTKTHTIHVDGVCLYKRINWIGAGVDEYWATGGNWEGGNPPDIVGEAAIFSNATSSKNCTIQSGDAKPGLIYLKSDYTGIITVPGAWIATNTDLEVDGGTYGAGQPWYCRNLFVTGGYFPEVGSIYGFKVYISGSSVIFDQGLVFTGSGDVDIEFYQPGQTGPGYSPRIDNTAFSKNGTVNLLTDYYSGNIGLGYELPSVTEIINVGSHILGAGARIYAGSEPTDITVIFASGGTLWDNMDGGSDAFELNYVNSKVVIGVSGGVPWNLRSSGVGEYFALGWGEWGADITIYGPSEGGEIDIGSRYLCQLGEPGKIIMYGGDLKAKGFYQNTQSYFDLDSSHMEITGKLPTGKSWIPGVIDESILSLGTFSAGVTSSLLISSQEDNVIQGISPYNLAIDSGGIGIDVTASGCMLKGSIDEGTGDHIILGGGSTWEEAKVKWIGLGANDNWVNSANWQGGHIPETDDIAWFKGIPVRKCLINTSTPVPTEILVEADYVGALAEINCGVGDWGTETLKLTVYGNLTDNFKLGNSYSDWKKFGDVYFERGYLGYNTKVGIYGNLYFAGDYAFRLISRGTTDKIWEFHTQSPYPWGVGPQNYINDLYFYHLDCNVTVKGELYLLEWLNYGIDNDGSEGYAPEGHTKTVTYDNDTIFYTGMTTEETMAFYGLLDRLDIIMSPGVTVQHLYPDFYNKVYPGWFMVGNGDDYSIGASGSGLWDFDGYFDGQDSYGGYYHRQLFGYCVGCMNRWHHKPNACDAYFYGMAPGHHFWAHECGLHIENRGKWIGYGGDIKVKWFEIDENGYFDQSNGKLIITGKESPVLDKDPYAPGEPYDDGKWAVWSKGTWVWTPGASVVINSEEDVQVLGAELPNLVIDSGGHNITVTASGCKFYGEPVIASGDKLNIEGDTITVQRQLAPAMQVSSQVGEDLIYEVNVEMEGD